MRILQDAIYDWLVAVTGITDVIYDKSNGPIPTAATYLTWGIVSMPSVGMPSHSMVKGVTEENPGGYQEHQTQRTLNLAINIYGKGAFECAIGLNPAAYLLPGPAISGIELPVRDVGQPTDLSGLQGAVNESRWQVDVSLGWADAVQTNPGWIETMEPPEGTFLPA